MRPRQTSPNSQTRHQYIKHGETTRTWHTLTHVITGARRKNKLRQCRAMYAFGSSTPIANTPIARTTRVNSSVIVLIVSVSPLPQLRGSKMFRAYGPGERWLQHVYYGRV